MVEGDKANELLDGTMVSTSNTDQVARTHSYGAEGGLEVNEIETLSSPGEMQSDDSFVEEEDFEDQTYEAAISWPVVLLVVLQPISWIKLPGDRDLIWLCPIIAALALIVRPFRAIASVTEFVRTAPWLHGLYIAYFVIITMSLRGSRNFEDGLWHLTLGYVLFAAYLLLGANLIQLSLPALSRTMRLAVPLSVLTFALACTISMAAKGENLVSVLITSLQSGNAQYFTAKFTRSVFSFSLSSLGGGQSEAVWEGARNAVGASFIFLAGCYASFAPITNFRRMMAVGAMLMLAFAIGTLFLCRSAQVSFVLMIVSAYMHYQFSGTGLLNRSLPVLVFLMCIILGLSFLFVESNDLIQMTIERFSAISEDARIDHYQLMWQGIVESPLWGQGLGAEIGDGRKGHNFILAAWFRAGIFGGLAALAFYLIFVFKWMEATILNLRNFFTSEFVSKYWLPTLLVGPIFRRMISGDDGRFVLVEWFSVAVFLVARSKLLQEEASLVLDEEDEWNLSNEENEGVTSGLSS